MEPITNRVAQGSIEVYDLSQHWDGQPVTELDIEPFLYEGLMLREKEFRQAVKAHDWTAYEGHHVAIYCSADAVVPTWAYMFIATKLQDLAASATFGQQKDLLREHFARALAAEDWSAYEGKNVVVKGCGSQVVPVSAYVDAVQRLQEVAAKLMFGEPCSSVPLWRKPAPKKPAAAAKPAGVKKPDLPTPSAS